MGSTARLHRAGCAADWRVDAAARIGPEVAHASGQVTVRAGLSSIEQSASMHPRPGQSPAETTAVTTCARAAYCYCQCRLTFTYRLRTGGQPDAFVCRVRSTECVTAWLPQNQWELCAQSLLAQGLHHVDARTVPLQLQVTGAAMVRNEQRTCEDNLTRSQGACVMSWGCALRFATVRRGQGEGSLCRLSRASMHMAASCIPWCSTCRTSQTT